MPVYFTPRTLAFLRALKRHNEREWFRAHKDEYERDVRGPMAAVVERLAVEFGAFAPDLIASPRESIFRIYRDTRFSPDKRPLKTHVAAAFRSRGLPRGAGAGLYFHVDPNEDREVWIGGGTYAPERNELVRIRAHIAAHLARFRSIVESPRFTRALGGLEGARLTRTPRGFPADHPAAEYLKHTQLYAGRSYDVRLATAPRFLPELLRVFRLVAPLVRFLNEPLLEARTRLGADPLAAETARSRRLERRR